MNDLIDKILSVPLFEAREEGCSIDALDKDGFPVPCWDPRAVTFTLIGAIAHFSQRPETVRARTSLLGRIAALTGGHAAIYRGDARALLQRCRQAPTAAPVGAGGVGGPERASQGPEGPGGQP